MFPGRLNWCGKPHPECGQHNTVCWGDSGLSRKNKSRLRTSICLSLLPDWMPVASYTCFHDFLTMNDRSQTGPKQTPPSLSGICQVLLSQPRKTSPHPPTLPPGETRWGASSRSPILWDWYHPSSIHCRYPTTHQGCPQLYLEVSRTPHALVVPFLKVVEGHLSPKRSHRLVLPSLAARDRNGRALDVISQWHCSVWEIRESCCDM